LVETQPRSPAIKTDRGVGGGGGGGAAGGGAAATGAAATGAAAAWRCVPATMSGAAPAPAPKSRTSPLLPLLLPADCAIADDAIDVESNAVTTGGATRASLPYVLRNARRSTSTASGSVFEPEFTRGSFMGADSNAMVVNLRLNSTKINLFNNTFVEAVEWDGI